jgi:peroxiredoxin
MRVRWGLAALVATVALGASSAAADVKAGDDAPAVTAKAWLNVKADEQPTAERLKGKVVMVEFWGTWCNPCVQAMPHVQKLWDRYRDRGLLVLAVSYEEIDVLKAFLDKNGYTMPCGSDPDKTCIAAYTFKSWPHTVVIGKDGKLAFVGDPMSVEPAIEKALGLEATPTSLLAQYVAAAGGPSKGREILERLVEKAPSDFDLKSWAAESGGVADTKPALAIDGAKHLTEYVKLCAAAKPDAAKKQAELDWLAAGAPDKFDLGAWARVVLARDFPLTTKELAKLLDDKQFDAAVDAILDRNPSPEALGAASKSIPFAVFCTQHAAEARTNAKKALMALLWVFAKKQPKDNKAFWNEINVTAWQENPDRSPKALQIGGVFVSDVGAAAYVDRQLGRFQIMDALKDGKKPDLAGLRAGVARERDMLTKELKGKYEQ